MVVSSENYVMAEKHFRRQFIPKCFSFHPTLSMVCADCAGVKSISVNLI